MELGTTSHTGDYPFMDKLHKINHHFDTLYFKSLHKKQYGGIITDCIIVPISIFEEENEDLKWHKKKFVQKHKNWDGDYEASIIFNLYINPLIIQKLSTDEIQQLYCDLIINQLNDPNFKLPKNFDSMVFKLDLKEIVEDFRQQKIPHENTI